MEGMDTAPTKATAVLEDTEELHLDPVDTRHRAMVRATVELPTRFQFHKMAVMDHNTALMVALLLILIRYGCSIHRWTRCQRWSRLYSFKDDLDSGFP